MIDHLALEQFKKYLTRSKARVAVSLSSGGAEAMGRDMALMEMLVELGIDYHEVHGTSAGSPVAATYCFFKPIPHDDYDPGKGELSIYEMRRRYMRVMSFSTIFSLSFKSLKKFWSTWRAKSITGIFSGKKLERKIAIAMNGSFQDCRRDVYIYAESEGRLDYEVFSKKNHPNMPLSKAIRASISMPHVFEPQNLEGQNYIDGGLLVNTPLRVIYENHIADKENAKRPLVILACTSMYPFHSISKDKNIWNVMKDRYFYKLMNRIFYMEFEQILRKKNVMVLLFYPQVARINSFAFQKVDKYLLANKSKFYQLFNEYLNNLSYSGFHKKARLKLPYSLTYD